MTLIRVDPLELEDYRNEVKEYPRCVDYAEVNVHSGVINIGRSWDGIIFLLTGKNSSLADHLMVKIFFNDQVVDDRDIGYGPAHYVSPKDVQKLSQVLSTIGDEQLERKYDVERMKKLEVYPNWWHDPEMKNYLFERFQQVKNMYAIAAENSEGMITFLD